MNVIDRWLMSKSEVKVARKERGTKRKIILEGKQEIHWWKLERKHELHKYTTTQLDEIINLTKQPLVYDSSLILYWDYHSGPPAWLRNKIKLQKKKKEHEEQTPHTTQGWESKPQHQNCGANVLTTKPPCPYLTSPATFLSSTGQDARLFPSTWFQLAE